jgi:hypothetical protein
MSLKTNTPRATKAKRIYNIGVRRFGLRSMSESQIRAYLAARDAVRRIQRTSSMIAPPGRGALDLGEQSELIQ